MKKRVIYSLGICVVIATLIAIGAYAASDIKLLINGKSVAADVQIVDGSSYVPLRVVSESLGAGVQWDDTNRTISINNSNSSPQSSNVDYVFTKDHPEKTLIGVIGEAKETLDIAIYSLTHPDIVQAIKDAKKRGVVVRIITDKTQSGGKSQVEALKILGSAGIPLKINSHSGLMHLKVTIADKKVATTGSYNYSAAASTVNDEVLVIMRDETIAQSFSKQFEKMWIDESKFKSNDKWIAMPDQADEETSEVKNTIEPTPTSIPTEQSKDNVSYKSCAEVKSAGKAPIHRGEPGYSAKLDRDGDGVACE